MGNNSVEGYPKSIGIPWVDRLSTGAQGFWGVTLGACFQPKESF